MSKISFTNVITAPAPATTTAADRRRKLDNDFAANVERKLRAAFGVEPAKVDPEPLTLATVKTGVTGHKNALATARHQLRNATEATRPAALAALCIALDNCGIFSEEVCNYVEQNPLDDSNEVLHYSLAGLASLSTNLESEFLA